MHRKCKYPTFISLPCLLCYNICVKLITLFHGHFDIVDDSQIYHFLKNCYVLTTPLLCLQVLIRQQTTKMQPLTMNNFLACQTTTQFYTHCSHICHFGRTAYNIYSLNINKFYLPKLLRMSRFKNSCKISYISFM